MTPAPINGTPVYPPLPPICPFCHNDDLRTIDIHRTYCFCTVCGKAWPRVDMDVSGVVIDGE